MALLVGPLALLLSGCSAQSVERNLRFGWHTGVTKQATEMRTLWTWAGVTALIVGVFMWGLIFWAIIAYRKKSDELPKQTKYNLPLEIAYSVAPFIIIAGLFYRTVVVEDNVNQPVQEPRRPRPGGRVQVELAVRVPHLQGRRRATSSRPPTRAWPTRSRRTTRSRRSTCRRSARTTRSRSS